jgi:hypothetical protein
VSPDVKILTTSPKLTSFWIFDISPGTTAGTWTVEIRIDGQPGGSHAFEVAGTEGTTDKFTLDRVMKAYGPAVVRIYKLDGAGHRIDASSGCVIGPNAVATAFQAIDMAARLEIEFSDGRKAQSAEILDLSRLDDWAIIKVDTANVAPIPRGDAANVPVGGRLAAFAIESGTRVMMPVDVGAVSAPTGYGLRIRFSPPAGTDAAGGPVIDEGGRLVALLGGSLTPGARLAQSVREQYPRLMLEAPGNTASAVSLLPATLPAAGKSLADLQASSVLTAALTPMPELDYGGVTKQLPKSIDQIGHDDREFSSHEDAPAIVYGYWKKRGKLSKGEVSGAIFDATNRQRGSLPAKKISLKDEGERVSYSFSLKGLPAGYYRIDLLWNGAPAWRTYIHVID